ncbi:DUF7351 domain-containing protein [Halovivax cerinus]|uniref:ArsR family transcriptional regulator n=1 Tax=Halovivax cerinus TaxID=1487865 RepID=A0ABD5NKG0_9EURY|nr:ArsR family transcriptional regulator [Halovivax cerinus]
MDERAPHESFAKLADETRVDILRAVAVAERDRESGGEEPYLSFSELRDRVEVSNSSRFAYHLDQLTGTFLHKADRGYTFTWSGERIVRTILAGGYGTPIEFDSVPVEGACPACGADALRAGAERVMIRVRCADCDGPIASFPLTPGLAADREPEAIVQAAERRTRSDFDDIFAGDCPKCAGRLDHEIRERDALPGDPFLTINRCRECLAPFGLPLSMWALSHPATVAFYWNRGIDIRSKPIWNLFAHLSDGGWTVEVESEPRTYRVTLREDEDELRLTFDADLSVTDVARLTSEA